LAAKQQRKCEEGWDKQMSVELDSHFGASICGIHLGQEDKRLLNHWGVAQGLDLLTFATGTEALLSRPPEAKLIVVDEHVPDMTAMQFCSALRRTGSLCPVLCLGTSAPTDVEPKLLAAGADVYVQRPYDPGQVAVRLRAFVPGGQCAAPPRLSCGPIGLDRHTGAVTVGPTLVDLTRTQFNMLAYLLAEGGRIVPAEELAREVLGCAQDCGDMSKIRIHISKLRTALGSAGDYLTTVWGRGYALRPPAESDPGEAGDD
jgi:DNA-binding response OmpR family regulator